MGLCKRGDKHLVVACPCEIDDHAVFKGGVRGDHMATQSVQSGDGPVGPADPQRSVCHGECRRGKRERPDVGNLPGFQHIDGLSLLSAQVGTS